MAVSLHLCSGTTGSRREKEHRSPLCDEDPTQERSSREEQDRSLESRQREGKSKPRPWMEGGGSKHYARSTVSIAIAGRLGNWMFLVGVVSLVARNIAQQDSCTSFLSL